MTKYGSSGWSHWDNNYTIIIHLRIKDNHGPVLADVRRDWGYWGPGSVRLLQSCLSAKYPNKWFFFQFWSEIRNIPWECWEWYRCPAIIWQTRDSRCLCDIFDVGPCHDVRQWSVVWSMVRRPAWLPAGPKVVVSSRAVLIWPALWFFIGASSSVGPCLGMGRLNEALLYISQSYIHSLHSPSQHQ